ncbi:hypothetical protein V6N13_035228 [Hibiscus sabdariffa]
MDLRKRNLCLLAKWLWGYSHSDNSLWHNIIIAKLTVKLARFQPVQHGRIFWRKNETSILNRDAQDHVLRKEDGVSSNQSRMELKRIHGYVEEEELWKMKRRLVGVMATVCSVRNITSRLSKWGMGEFKEIFCEVSPWSESLNRLERATWLEVSGVPLHCWNSTTLKRLANLWGNFEALGENADHVLDCEKVSILITTNHAKRIEEVVEIELGNMVYEIGVFELGFSDSSKEIISRKGIINNESCKVNKVSASVASTSLESMKEELEGDRSISTMEIETLNVMRPKEVCNYYQARESETQGYKIGWELHTLRADEDERDMGFKPLREITDSGSRKYMDLWAKAVDEKFNEGLSNAISDSFIMGLQLEVVLLGKA